MRDSVKWPRFWTELEDIHAEVSINAPPPTALEINLTDKRNSTAKVWKYFGLQLDENGKASDVNNPMCHLCSMPVSVKNSNTSNLYSHLMKQHPEQYEEVQPKVKPGTSDSKTVSNMCSIKTAFEKVRRVQKDASCI